MKIKIFTSLESQELEQDINDFIKGKDIIDIKQSLTYAVDRGIFGLAVMVLYNENQEINPNISLKASFKGEKL